MRAQFGETVMKLSVITATYNSVATLPDCLESLRIQRHPDMEHLVIDGGSRDGTLALLQERRAQIDQLVSEPDEGIYDALNKGLRLSTGEVVGFLHSDDFYPDAEVLADVARAFDDPRVSAVYGDLEYVGRSDVTRVIRRWKGGDVGRYSIALGWMPPHPTLFARRSVYEAIGGFDTKLRIAADYHSVLKMFLLPGFTVRYIRRVLVKMRVGGVSNRSLSNMVEKSRQDLCALRATGFGGPLTVLAKNLRKLPQFLA
jgi:glycosyltransferase